MLQLRLAYEQGSNQPVSTQIEGPDRFLFAKPTGFFIRSITDERCDVLESEWDRLIRRYDLNRFSCAFKEVGSERLMTQYNFLERLVQSVNVQSAVQLHGDTH